MPPNSPTTPAQSIRPPLPPTEGNLLKSEPPPTFKATGTSLEMRALEQTLALINNTSVTGAQLPPEEREAQKAILTPPAALVAAPAVSTPEVSRLGVVQSPSPVPTVRAENDPGETVGFVDPVHTTPAAPVPAAPAAQAARPVVEARRVMLTGRTGTGKDHIASMVSGAHVLNLDTPIWTLVRGLFPDGPAAGVFSAVQTIKAWGSGIVSDKYPITPARIMFVENARGTRAGWANFGRPDFWAELVLLLADSIAEQVVVTGVETLAEFSRLAGSGFVHYHVVCSSASYAARPKRPGANDSLSAALDQQVTKQLSADPRGRILRCVWSDPVPPPSPRLMSVEHWLKEIAIQNLPETGE